MKKHKKQKTTIIALLTASCLGMALWGCASEEKANMLKIEPIASEEDIQTTYDVKTQTTSETNTQAESTDAQTNSEAATADSKDTPADSENPQEPTASSQSLYEQFLNGSISATVDAAYSEGDYSEQILEKNSALTLSELERRVSDYFFNPERTDKTSCDLIQYAYVDCPDSADKNDKNLLVKFVGLNIYSQDDDSYAVFILTEDNDRLSITDSYQCWARSETTAYANGTLHGSGSSGAGDHGADLSVILSDGKPTSIYDARILSGQWAASVGGSLYQEVFGDNTETALTVFIYTIGDEEYYQCDMTYCEETEIPLCETYINRCRDEADINWVSEKEIQTAIQNRCTAAGVDYSIVESGEEADWIDLP